MSAGYTPGVPRLGVPAMLMSDAGLGITNPGYREGDTATALPSGLSSGSSFNPALSHNAGGLLGREARSRGFNVQLAAGANLVRDPRNGRNFEYFSEDPLLSGILAGEVVNGVQAEGVISTVKHFTLNSNETNRQWLDAIIDPAAHREADLLVFEIAIERSQPGAIMASYNKINGTYATLNKVTLTEVLRDAWDYRGWAMSDWGATPSWEAALAGLDQECGVQLDVMAWGSEAFTDKLRAAHADGRLPKERLSEMIRRILRSMFAVGIDTWTEAITVDEAAHEQIALEGARQGIVLLKNDDSILPLRNDDAPRIAVIGGHSQIGVPAGAGSSTVIPKGGFNEVIKVGGPGIMGVARNLHLYGEAPLDTLRELMPNAQIEFDPGMSRTEAARLAKRSDIAIVFAVNLMGEGFDSGDIDLPWGQSELISAVAAANPNTVVVLETGSAVTMPWNDQIKAVVEAWYPGQAGGRAIAEVLTGAVYPSGHLPVTFPVGLEQTPRPELDILGTPWETPVSVEYTEGSEVGYRWLAQTGERPLYAFGHGLSYTSFRFDDLTVTGGENVEATFTVTNTGDIAGADVPQLYLTHVEGTASQRLLGFERVELQPGESRSVTITADPRLLASYDSDAGAWSIHGGEYRIALSHSAVEEAASASVPLISRHFGR